MKTRIFVVVFDCLLLETALGISLRAYMIATHMHLLMTY